MLLSYFVVTTIAFDVALSGSGLPTIKPRIIFARVMPDKQVILTVTEDKMVRFIPANGGSPIQTFIVERLGVPGAIDLSCDGRMLAIGHASGVELWDTASGRKCATQVKAASSASKLLFSPNSKTLLVSHQVNSLTSRFPALHMLWLYNLDNGQRLQECGVCLHIEHLAFSSDGAKVILLTGGKMREVVLRSADDK